MNNINLNKLHQNKSLRADFNYIDCITIYYNEDKDEKYEAVFSDEMSGRKYKIISSNNFEELIEKISDHMRFVTTRQKLSDLTFN